MRGASQCISTTAESFRLSFAPTLHSRRGYVCGMLCLVLLSFSGTETVTSRSQHVFHPALTLVDILHVPLPLLPSAAHAYNCAIS